MSAVGDTQEPVDPIAQLENLHDIDDDRVRDQEIEEIAVRLHAAGQNPEWQVSTADFDRDVFLICADRYWRLRFLDKQVVATAVECGRWFAAYVDQAAQAAVFQQWTKGYAFITRGVIEDNPEIRDLITDADTDLVGYFAACYQSLKLKFAFRFGAQATFIDSVRNLGVVSQARSTDPFWIAQEAAARFGDRKSAKNYAEERLEIAWHGARESEDVADVCVSAVRYARGIDGQGALLTQYADKAVELYPDNHIFLAAAATGHHMIADLGRKHEEKGTSAATSGNPDLERALELIDDALTKLPPMGERTSYELFQGQYMAKREAIVDSMIHHDRIAARDRQVEQERRKRDLDLKAQQERLEDKIVRVEQAMDKADDQNRANQVRSVELVAVFSAVIAFAVGAFQVANDDSLGLRDRSLLLLVWGGLNIGFVLLVVGGTWIIARSRDKKPGPRVEQKGSASTAEQEGPASPPSWRAPQKTSPTDDA